jgi:hypothetical protein
MLETKKYVRKPFQIDAVQVTEDNMAEVAKWVQGDIRTDADNKKYIKVRVHRPMNNRQTQAYAGDHVLYAGTGFKVYTPKAFKDSFELAMDSEPLPDDHGIMIFTEQPQNVG